MRSATVVLRSRSTGRYLFDAARFVAETPAVTDGAIEHVNTLADGTAVVLTWFRAPVEPVRSYLDENDRGLTTDITPAPDGVVVYSHFQPSGLVDSLLGLRRKYEVVFDVPMAFTDDGGIRATLIGREAAIQAAIDGMPDEVGITLQAMTEYNPVARGPLATLTDRQLETLQLAVDRGYYDSPREVTARALAAELGCSRGTASEHLRKAERYVLSEVLD